MAGRVNSVVVDASVMMALAMVLPTSERATALMDGWQRDRVPLYAPLLWEYELATAVRKAVALGIFLEEQAVGTLDRLLSLGIQRVAPDAGLHREALRWAGRLGQVAAYDAQYLALAARLGAQFWSADRRLVERARAQGVDWVHHIVET